MQPVVRGAGVPVGDSASATAAETATVSVLYFAALRELAGTSEELLALPIAPSPSVATLLAALELRHPALRGRLETVRVAVNEEFVELSTQLRGDEVVALIPPVSGG